MCGIAGYSGAFSPGVLEPMSAALRWRGPDGEGRWSDEAAGVGLAHRRLAILDTRPEGDQPMANAAGDVVICYNGEIYNYRELRRELEGAGFAFRTGTDTEVLLALYERDGAAMLERLNGIFAFAIWDAKAGRMLLARDHAGVKPLYYAQTPSGVLFASELKALRAWEGLDRTVDARAIALHLSYLWAPAPYTMFRAVRKLEPGMAMTLEGGRVARRWRHYALPEPAPEHGRSEAAWAGALAEVFERCVTRQLVSDVPVGAFLSGGLDSSAIVAMMARAGTLGDFPCYTIAFEGSEDPGLTADLPYARRAAAHLGVRLEETPVAPAMLEDLPTMLFHLDEPQADPAPLNALAIARAARADGIKVLLSGAGGDDVFTGYRRHLALRMERYWSWSPRALRRAARAASTLLPAGSGIGRRARKQLANAHLDPDDRLVSYFLWLDAERRDALLSPDLREALEGFDPLDPLRETLAAHPARHDPIERMLLLEQTFFLPDHNLNYTDKTTMAAGVEGRVPFLDPELLAFAARIPTELKQKGRTGKHILKKAMEPFLPREVIHRPKTGFGVPLRRWMEGELRELVEETLDPRTLRDRGWFDPQAVARLRADNAARRLDAAYPLFALVCLELWARLFIDAQPHDPPKPLHNVHAN